MRQYVYGIAACGAFRNYDMHSRRSHGRPIELRESSFLHPLVKSFLLVVSVSAVIGGGYFIGRSSSIRDVALGHEVDSAAQLAAAEAPEASPPKKPIDAPLPVSQRCPLQNRHAQEWSYVLAKHRCLAGS